MKSDVEAELMGLLCAAVLLVIITAALTYGAASSIFTPAEVYPLEGGMLRIVSKGGDISYMEKSRDGRHYMKVKEVR